MNDEPRATAPPRRPSTRRRHTASDVELARLARALAHPARVRIVRLLVKRGECMCGQIVLDLPLAQATVSQHLKVLKEAGIVRGDVDGPRVCYCLAPGALERLKRLIHGL
jgi:ArsR family transcriptional regulator